MNIDDVYVNYIDYGSGTDTIVLLHGWGQNIAMMKCIGDRFIKTHRVIILDLPGYGESTEPTSVWSVYDYVECVHKLLTNLKVSSPILIGHSFGGKISLLYASMYDTKKLICLASPYKKAVERLSIKTKALKLAKKIPVINKLEDFAKKHIGSTDYKSASVMMRKILVNTVNLDLTNEVKKISCPTLLIWGTSDNAVPYDDALELESLIKGSGLVTYEGCTHYAYLERLEQTINVLYSFLEVNK